MCILLKKSKTNSFFVFLRYKSLIRELQVYKQVQSSYYLFLHWEFLLSIKSMAERIVPQRFLDAGKEPHQTLTPIRGYENAPLVSLREAVEPIKSLLYDADSMVEIARRNSKKPADGLTTDESGAIHLYTMQWPEPHPSLFTLLNERLRAKNRNTLISWFLFLKLFFTALYKLPSLKGVIYRGVRGNLSDEYDEDHFWWGTSSCTETMNVMETFVGSEGDRTIFNVECINGKSIQPHSYFTEENEILLMPGSYFKVVSKWKPAKGLYIIHLREQTPPYQTMAPPFNSASTSNITTSVEKLTIATPQKSLTSGNTASAKPRSKLFLSYLLFLQNVSIESNITIRNV